MTMYTFQTYPASVSAKFSCAECGKANRTRTFRHECTVNPFNKNDDGSIKTPKEVRAQSLAHAKKDRDEFMMRPICASCEKELTFKRRKEIQEERRAALALMAAE